MPDQQQFRVVAWWTAGRTGIAKSSSAPNAIHFTSPPVFGGLDGRWTPEDLLLRAVAEAAKFEYTDMQVEVEGSIGKTDGGYRFGEVSIRPNLIISQQHEKDGDRALKLLHRAEELCLVAHALSVKQRFEPRVQVSEARGGAGQPLPVSDQKN